MSILKHKYFYSPNLDSIQNTFTLYENGTMDYTFNDETLELNALNITNYIDVLNNKISILLVIQGSTGTTYLYPIGYKDNTTKYTEYDMVIVPAPYHKIKIVVTEEGYGVLMINRITVLGNMYGNNLEYDGGNRYYRIFSNNYAMCAIEKGTNRIITWGHPKYGGLLLSYYKYDAVVNIYSHEKGFTAVVKRGDSVDYLSWGIM